MRKSYLLMCLLILFSKLIYCQEYIIKKYGLEEGLEGPITYCFYQDSLGLIWMGSNVGLHCFDGESFINYPKPNNTYGDIIWRITKNFNNNLLILNYQGKLWEFDGIEYKAFKCGISAIDTARIKLIDRHKEKLFISTFNKEMYIFTKDTIYKENALSGLNYNFCRDNNDRLYFMMSDGVYRMTDDSIKYLYSSNKPLLANSYELTNNKQLGVSYYDGVFVRNGSEWDSIFDINNNIIYGSVEDIHQNIWLATHKGLYRLKPDSKQNYDAILEINKEKTLRVFEDRDNQIWVSSYGNGVYRIRKNQFENFYYPDDIPGDLTVHLLKDKNEKLWLTAFGYGISCYNGNDFKHFNTYEKFGKRNILSGIETDSSIFLAGENIFLDYKDGKFNEINIQNTPKPYRVWEMTCHNNDIYCIVKPDQIGKISDRKYSCLVKAGKNQTYEYLFKDFNDTMWVASNKGLYKLVNDSLIKITGNKKMDTASIYTLSNSTDSALWVGTNKGLFKLKKQEVIEHITSKNGLIIDEIFSLGIHNNRLYIGTRYGFSIYSDHGIQSFSKSDGLSNNYILPPSVCFTNDKMVIGTGNGISIKQVGSKEKLSDSRNIIARIYTKGDTISNNLIKPKLEQSYTFSAGTNEVNFDLIVVNQKSRFKNYRYKLSGSKETDYTYTKSTKISLKDLKFGEYIFSFESQNEYGKWNSKVTQHFFIESPFYFKRQAFIVYIALLLCVLAYFIYRIKTKNGKYHSSSLSKKKYELIRIRFIDHIETDKVYRNPEISLSFLAEKLLCSKEHLSQVINTEYKQNFNTLINSHRINEAKDLLIKFSSKEKTILEIAFEVGFNSKTAFNTAFKKFTNCSPTEYRKDKCKENASL